MKYRRGPATCQFSSQDDETTRWRLFEGFGVPLSKSPISKSINKSPNQEINK